MEYIHIRSLDKYHPGYKDRTLQWAKIFINMADGDPDTELIENEIDWARLIKIILLELRAQKPLPNIDKFWIKKGFDIKKRSMSLTLQMLHNFIDTVTEDLKPCNESVTQSREDKSREDKDKNKIYSGFEEATLLTWNDFCIKKPLLSKIKEISEKRRLSLKKRFSRDSFKMSEILAAAEKQSFLFGDNDRKWVFTFDWLIENDTNYLKVLELRYQKKTQSDIKAADPECRFCQGTGWVIADGGKKLCHCRINK